MVAWLLLAVLTSTGCTHNYLASPPMVFRGWVSLCECRPNPAGGSARSAAHWTSAAILYATIDTSAVVLHDLSAHNLFLVRCLKGLWLQGTLGMIALLLQRRASELLTPCPDRSSRTFRPEHSTDNRLKMPLVQVEGSAKPLEKWFF